MTQPRAPRTSAWERHRVVRLLACQAHDPDDLAVLLDVLGLSAREGVRPDQSDSAEPGPSVRTRTGSAFRT